MRTRGYTLIELLIASVIGGLVLTMAITLYRMTLVRESSDEGVYALEADATHVIDLVRSDLRETYRPSIRIFSDQQNGVSFVSASAIGEIHNFQVSRFGAPKWQKQVFYGLKPVGGQPGLAQLFRHEEQMSTALPKPWVGAFPSTDGSGDRVVSRNLLAPGYQLQSTAEGALALQQGGSGTGGFQVRFVYPDNSLQTTPPAPQHTTQLVDVQLKLVQLSPRGKPDSTSFSFRVYPRN